MTTYLCPWRTPDAPSGWNQWQYTDAPRSIAHANTAAAIYIYHDSYSYHQHNDDDDDDDASYDNDDRYYHDDVNNDSRSWWLWYLW